MKFKVWHESKTLKELLPWLLVISLLTLILLIVIKIRTGFAEIENDLSSDDTASVGHPPLNFEKKRLDIVQGNTDPVQYYSKSVGNKRRFRIYFPPGYSKDSIYPVLYLLHGIAGDEGEWFQGSSPQVIFDNMVADNKIQPMIVVFPNGRAMRNDSAGGNAFDPEKVKAFKTFEQDLFVDLMPFIELNYPVRKDRLGRALAGFSMGAGQSLNIGLRNPEKFAWLGGFSLAGTELPEVLVDNPSDISQKIKLLYISCGDKDDLLFVTQYFHDYLKSKAVPHVYQINAGGHVMELWKSDLYLFAERIFR